MLTITILIAVAFLAGWCLGRRLGRRQGLEEGSAVTRLRIREQSLVDGRCAVCQRRADGGGLIKTPVLQRIGTGRGMAATPLDAGRKFTGRRQTMYRGV